MYGRLYILKKIIKMSGFDFFEIYLNDIPPTTLVNMPYGKKMNNTCLYKP